MRYKILCSDGYEPVTFYCDDIRQADLLYRMAVESKMFVYVELARVSEECFPIQEWVSDDDD